MKNFEKMAVLSVMLLVLAALAPGKVLTIAAFIVGVALAIWADKLERKALRAEKRKARSSGRTEHNYSADFEFLNRRLEFYKIFREIQEER